MKLEIPKISSNRQMVKDNDSYIVKLRMNAVINNCNIEEITLGRIPASFAIPFILIQSESNPLYQSNGKSGLYGISIENAKYYCKMKERKMRVSDMVDMSIEVGTWLLQYYMVMHSSNGIVDLEKVCGYFFDSPYQYHMLCGKNGYLSIYNEVYGK